MEATCQRRLLRFGRIQRHGKSHAPCAASLLNASALGRSNQRDAVDDREFERIMAMTEDELIEDAGGREAFDKQVAEARESFERAVAEAERRTGKK